MSVVAAATAPGSSRPLPALLAGFAERVPAISVTGVEMDSRRVAPGNLFLACRGHAQHGLTFLDQATRQGAAVVAWEPVPQQAVPVARIPEIAVEHLSARAGEIASR